jgi:hypothetical protein
MKSTLALVILALTLACSAFAQTDSATTIKRAADAVPVLRSRMTDPQSFTLEAVHTAITKDAKCHGKGCVHPVSITNLCFEFRSHNAMGGYGQPNVAVLISENDGYLLHGDSGKLLVIGTTEEAETNSGFAVPEWSKACRSKKFDVDITAEVKAALTPAPTPAASPAEQAEQAQQRADCLKLAVKNPSIVCKP